MILTQCVVCATELGLTLGKKCGRCSTRYCGPECQVQHWKEGGHDKLCKQIKKAGGAEQYNANKKYTEAVAAAVEKCADDTKGQTCYICTEAVHRRTGEGLVRGCACGDRDGVASGTTGIVHVSCLEEQAKILFAEVEESNLDDKVFNATWQRWTTCSLCKQQYNGVVACALGWGCWKTYVGRRSETDEIRCMAMNLLGRGLNLASHYEDALSVREAELARIRRFGASEHQMLVVQANLAITFEAVGRYEEGILMKRDVYFGRLRLNGEEDRHTLVAAHNYAEPLLCLRRFEEARALLRRTIPVAQSVLGESDEITLRMRKNYGRALFMDPAATLDDLREAVTTLEDSERTARRVFGGEHPLTAGIELFLSEARAALRAREAA